MAIFHLPPALRLQMLSRSLLVKPYILASGRGIRPSAALCSSRDRGRPYATVRTNNNKRTVGKTQARPSRPADHRHGGLPPKRNQAMTRARKANDKRPQGSKSEKTAVLAHVSKKSSTKHSPVRRESSRRSEKRRTQQQQQQQPRPGRIPTAPSATAEGDLVDDASESQANSARVDFKYVQDHMQIPSASDYPDAPLEIRNALSLLKPNLVRGVFDTYLRKKLKVIENYEEVTKGWLCELTLDAPGDFQQCVTGVGATKSQAANAAYVYTLSRLHTSGMLAALLSPATMEPMEPRKEQYPGAPPLLFEPAHTASIMHNILAARAPKTIQSGDYEAHADKSATFTLRLDIPGIADASATGRGTNKTMAKRAAWVAMLNRLHTHGALQQILPQVQISPYRPDDHNESKVFIRDESEIELVELDRYTVDQEKNATLDIYNYAARYGAIPQFKTQFAQHVRRRASRAKSRQTVVQASIRLPEHGIHVVTRGKDVATAEAAAALSFKREAEKQQTEQEHPRNPLPGYEFLTTDSAQDFLEWFRRLQSSTTLELELSIVNYAGVSANRARVLVDGSVLGDSTMRAKKAAQSSAYLMAAVAIANNHPEQMAQWVERKKNGEARRPMYSLSMPIDSRISDMMRETLVSARQAGLPDQRETFGAEEATRKTLQSRHRYLSSEARDLACEVHQESLKRFNSDSRLVQLRNTKAGLPMSQYTDQVVDLVSSDVYSIIIGATGSGKTTQVPQIFLDHAIKSGKGGYCDIICTQPRRLAASSVAQRVAAERDETIGTSVGYQVRGEVQLPRFGGSITYCTTGILLEQLKWNTDDIMDNVSHLVIDEVHERDIFVDFLLIILKKAVKARQEAGKKVPHIVLMSATLDQKLFSEYLPNTKDGKTVPCAALSVPGRTFPVTETYLEELVQDITSTHKSEFQSLVRGDKGVSQEYLDAELNFAQSSNGAAPVIIDWKRQYEADADSEGSSPGAQRIESLVPVRLLTAALAHICTKSDDGAILAFLPGLQEISATMEFLVQHPIFGVDFNDTSKFKIMPLHSSIPPDQQKLIFEPSPPGCRKIILATNIAETSVTVPDVKYVVDLGKLREKRYDQVKRITELQTVWESNSNARQRAGRAGRVSQGNYYALYTQQRRQAMSASGQAELLRSDLQETCLSIKAQGFQEPVAEFLADAIEPPPTKAVSLAVENLKSIEAFTPDEELTSLGRILSRLPVHPELGNMVLLGIVFRCLDPMIISSCMASERTLFVKPLGVARSIARRKHEVYAQDDSDHLAYINAFRDLRTQLYEKGQSGTFAYAHDRFLHFGAFKSVDQTTRLVEQALREAGLVDMSHQDRSNKYQLGGDALNANSNNTALLKALTLAGVYPNIAVRRAMTRSPVHRTASEDNVMMHPSSMNASSGKPAVSETDQIYAFSTLARSVSGDSLFIRDSTLVTPLMAFLFGGRVQTETYKTLVMDKWLPFAPVALNTEFVVRLCLEFRKAKDRMLYGAFKEMSNPHTVKTQARAREIFAAGLVNILSASEDRRGKMSVGYPESWQKRRSHVSNDFQGRGQSEGGRFANRSDDVRNQASGEGRQLVRFH